MVLHAIALILGIIGISAAFKYHNESSIDNFYSLHSWLGIGIIILYAIQVSLLISSKLCSSAFSRPKKHKVDATNSASSAVTERLHIKKPDLKSCTSSSWNRLIILGSNIHCGANFGAVDRTYLRLR